MFGCPAARREVISLPSKDSLPFSSASNTIYSVMILVREAGYLRASTLRAVRTLPEVPSTTSSA